MTTSQPSSFTLGKVVRAPNPITFQCDLLGLLMAILKISLEHKWFLKIILWCAHDSNPHLRHRTMMLPPHHCCRDYKGLWGRPVPHHVEMQLLQKGPVIVRRAQSVGTLPTAIEKSNQTPNPGHCLSTAASSIITAIPTMSHPSYRKIFRCSTHPYCCYCKHSLKSFPPSLYLFIALLLRSLYHN